MSILDRYIIRKFLGTFVFMTVALSAIVVVIDLSQKVSRIDKNGSSIGEALIEFYPYWALWIANTFMPVAVFVSVLYFTTRLALNTEIVATHAGGISFFRLSRSYLLGAILLAIPSLAINHFLLPKTNIKKNKYEYAYMLSSSKTKEQQIAKSLAAQISDSSYIFINAYRRSRSNGNGFLYEEFDNATGMTYRIRGNGFRWEEKDSTFRLSNYFERWTGNRKDSLSKGNSKNISLGLTPDELLPEAYAAETKNSIDLKKFIAREKFKGSSNINIYLLEYYKRTSISVTIIVLTLLALSFSSKKVRGGIGANLILGFVLAFLYIFIIESSKIFTSRGLMPPILAAWIGNIIFIPVSTYFYFKRAFD